MLNNTYCRIATLTYVVVSIIGKNEFNIIISDFCYSKTVMWTLIALFLLIGVSLVWDLLEDDESLMH